MNELEVGKDDQTRALKFRVAASVLAAHLSGFGDIDHTY
jgi:hypothetical protein